MLRGIASETLPSRAAVQDCRYERSQRVHIYDHYYYYYYCYYYCFCYYYYYYYHYYYYYYYYYEIRGPPNEVVM